jgi:hypothetical protein
VPVPFADLMTQSLVDKCSSWHVPMSMLEQELRRQNVGFAGAFEGPADNALQSSTIDIKLCIGALAVDEIAAQTKKERPGRPMDKKDEIVANVVWRFLDVRG